MPLQRLTQPPNTSLYEVASTDSLARIALRFDTTPSELSRLNHLSSTLLYPGQSLFVPKPQNDKGDAQQADDGSDNKTTTTTTTTTAPHREVSEPIDMQRLEVGEDFHAGEAFSPDLNLARLLNRAKRKSDKNSNNHSNNNGIDTAKDGDEISRQYLKLSSQHITEDASAVSGVLLVTPQTLMFNPCFSDHSVMEHGWDAYRVRLPLQTISRVFLFEDIDTMMEGDLSKQYQPKVQHLFLFYQELLTNNFTP